MDSPGSMRWINSRFSANITICISAVEPSAYNNLVTISRVRQGYRKLSRYPPFGQSGGDLSDTVYHLRPIGSEYGDNHARQGF